MKKDNLLHLVLLFHKYLDVAFFEPLTGGEMGITITQLVCLRYLYLNPNPTAGELAQGLGVSCGACTRTMDRLQEKGLATRKTSSQDRRIQRISLTEKGKAFVEEINHRLLKQFHDFLDGLTSEERVTFEEMLGLLLEKGLSDAELKEAACLRCGVLHMTNCPANRKEQLEESS